jgi:serine/threonine-protein kinase
MDHAIQPSSPASAPAELQPASPDWSGKSLGDFRLLRRLGQGGMGQVYLAEQISLKRKVAIKTMRTDVSVSAVSLQRFKAEAEAIARVTHANIVQVYAIGEEAGLHYMALEYVEGRNLGEYLAKKGPPELPLALRIMRQVAAALQRAGELGIIHRDIKPENILLTKRGEIKVADFGLSRCFADQSVNQNLTQSGITLGTPLYMSPEQVQGQALDPRTDIYSFGVTCYHLFAGRPPFQGQTPFEVALHHVRTEPVLLSEVRPDLPPELCAIVHKMLAKNREHRYPNCAELLRDLNQFRETLAAQKTQLQELGTLPALPSSTTAAAVTGPPPRGRRGWVGLAAATVILALLGGGLAAWLRSSAAAPASKASSTSSSAVVAEEPPAAEPSRIERLLREAVEEYANPGTDRLRRQLALGHNLELGLYYLKEDRLEEADGFFTNLSNSPAKVPAYRTLGRLGHAIVLARQNHATESNQLFLELVNANPKRAPQFQYFLNEARLRYEIARALEYNKANLHGQPLPQKLEELRIPPRPQHGLSPQAPGKKS